MNIVFRLLIIVGLIYSCTPKPAENQEKIISEKESSFNPTNYGKPISTISILSYPTAEEAKDSGSEAIVGISINDADKFIHNIIDADEIVLNDKKVQLIIDYPLKKSVIFKLENDKGFSRKDLILAIQEKYKEIYKIEEETAKIKTIPVNNREGLLNRNETDGKFGIWGHDLSDLYLTDIEVYKDYKGLVSLVLYIES